MNLLVLGATGPTGAHLVRRALDHGDTVTVVARRPDALGDLQARLRVVEGDATKFDDLQRAARHQDVIVSALGRGSNLRAHGLFSDAATALISATAGSSVRRLVWLTSFGVGRTYREASTLQKLIYSTLLRDIYADKARSEQKLRDSELSTTFVYPTRLTNGVAVGSYRAEEHLPMKGNPTISRADVAAFLHRAAHEEEWIGRDVVISG